MYYVLCMEIREVTLYEGSKRGLIQGALLGPIAGGRSSPPPLKYYTALTSTVLACNGQCQVSVQPHHCMHQQFPAGHTKPLKVVVLLQPLHDYLNQALVGVARVVLLDDFYGIRW